MYPALHSTALISLCKGSRAGSGAFVPLRKDSNVDSRDVLALRKDSMLSEKQRPNTTHAGKAKWHQYSMTGHQPWFAQQQGKISQ